ncbi:MAG: hypothetical protein HY899_15120 [Deltaproteobacteria bacterium]|nr:hypothetical protein [Deltaproteobacteria bacterium]
MTTRKAFALVASHRLSTLLVAGCLLAVASPAWSDNPCTVVDNGSGTVDLPPAGCAYLSPADVHLIIDGLPPGTTINAGVQHSEFFNVNRTGTPKTGETETFDSRANFQLQGTGDLSGYNRTLDIQVACGTQVGPRTPGAPTQSFDTEMLQLQGQLPPGDPDFDLLRITAGSGFGLPSPGHTTLTKLPSNNWAVDSFFDITYRIDFVGAPGGPLAGMSGSTTGTIRMSTGLPSAYDIDHFLTYQIKNTKGAPRFAKFGPVVLQDAFGAVKYDIVKPVTLDLPANKNNEGVVDDVTHLKEYQVRPRANSLAVGTTIQVQNQCGLFAVALVKPLSVLVPTNKSLTSSSVPAPDLGAIGLDHYLCYLVRQDAAVQPGLGKGAQVSATDQFQTRRYDLKKVTKICLPVAKSEDPADPSTILAGPNKGTLKPIAAAAVRHSDQYLVCYQTKPSRSLVPQLGCGCDVATDPNCAGNPIAPVQPRHTKVLGVFLNNQFGLEQIDTVKEREFCIPSRELP